MITITAQEAVLNHARSLLWLRETNGSNRSELIDEMIRRTGLDPTKRHPWCAAAIAWVGYAVLRKFWPLKKVAGCVSLFEDATAKGLIRTYPAVGAVFLQWREDKGRFAHAGFCEQPGLQEETWDTLEGNTNEAGHPDGVGFFARTRRFGPKDRFIHWWETTTP